MTVAVVAFAGDGARELRATEEASAARALNSPPVKWRPLLIADWLALAILANTPLRCFGPEVSEAPLFSETLLTCEVWPRETGGKAMLTPSLQIDALRSEWRQGRGGSNVSGK
jgi:hypothetical protein